MKEKFLPTEEYLKKELGLNDLTEEEYAALQLLHLYGFGLCSWEDIKNIYEVFGIEPVLYLAKEIKFLYDLISAEVFSAKNIKERRENIEEE